MAGLTQEIKSVSKSEYATAALYAGMIGLIASDIIPTPADALYFTIERNLRNKFMEKKITPKQYWAYETLSYYGLNPLYWALVLGITVSIKGPVTRKLYVASGIIGAGAVVGIIFSNIKKDVKMLALQKERENLGLTKV